MSGMTLPITRPSGRALVVGASPCRPGPVETLQQLGYQCAQSDDPYAAMAEVCRRPLVYRAIILSLSSLYREEMVVVGAIKKRFSHLEIYLAHVDGRGAALADAMRLGADGILSDEGLHRFALSSSPEAPEEAPPAPSLMTEPAAPAPAYTEPAEEDLPVSSSERSYLDDEMPVGEPVLTADELRALLQDQPTQPPSGGGSA